VRGSWCEVERTALRTAPSYRYIKRSLQKTYRARNAIERAMGHASRPVTMGPCQLDRPASRSMAFLALCANVAIPFLPQGLRLGHIAMTQSYAPTTTPHA
jgi:hypothetical protein